MLVDETGGDSQAGQRSRRGCSVLQVEGESSSGPHVQLGSFLFVGSD